MKYIILFLTCLFSLTTLAENRDKIVIGGYKAENNWRNIYFSENRNQLAMGGSYSTIDLYNLTDLKKTKAIKTDAFEGIIFGEKFNLIAEANYDGIRIKRDTDNVEVFGYQRYMVQPRIITFEFVNNEKQLLLYFDEHEEGEAVCRYLKIFDFQKNKVTIDWNDKENPKQFFYIKGETFVYDNGVLKRLDYDTGDLIKSDFKEREENLIDLSWKSNLALYKKTPNIYEIKNFKDNTSRQYKNINDVKLVSFSEDGKAILGYSGNKIIKISSENGDTLEESEFLNLEISSVQFQKKTALIDSIDGGISIFDLTGNKLLMTIYKIDKEEIVLDWMSQTINKRSKYINEAVLKSNPVKTIKNSAESKQYLSEVRENSLIQKDKIQLDKYTQLRESKDNKPFSKLTQQMDAVIVEDLGKSIRIEITAKVNLKYINDNKINKGARIYNKDYSEIGVISKETEYTEKEEADIPNFYNVKINCSIKKSNTENKMANSFNENIGLLLGIKYMKKNNKEFASLWIVRENGVIKLKRVINRLVVPIDKFYSLEKKVTKKNDSDEFGEDGFSDDMKFQWVPFDAKEIKKGNKYRELSFEDLFFVNRDISSTLKTHSEWASRKVYTNVELGVEPVYDDSIFEILTSIKNHLHSDGIQKFGIIDEEARWAIKHSEGKWRFFLAGKKMSGQYKAVSNEENWNMMPSEPPYSIVGDNEFALDWKETAAKLELKDGVMFRDYGILIGIKENEIVGMNGTDYSRNPDFNYSIETPQVISTQWVLGKNIEKWDEELMKNSNYSAINPSFLTFPLTRKLK